MGYFERVHDGIVKDRYAIRTTGVAVEEAAVCRSKCSLDVDERHIGRDGFVSNGALFTLIDYTFGVAANEETDNAVTLTADVSFIRRTKGPKLSAEARCIKDGRRVTFFEITVSDSEGVVATALTNGFRSNRE